MIRKMIRALQARWDNQRVPPRWGWAKPDLDSALGTGAGGGDAERQPCSGPRDYDETKIDMLPLQTFQSFSHCFWRHVDFFNMLSMPLYPTFLSSTVQIHMLFMFHLFCTLNFFLFRGSAFASLSIWRIHLRSAFLCFQNALRIYEHSIAYVLWVCEAKQRNANNWKASWDPHGRHRRY